MALLLSTARNIPTLDNSMHGNRFNSKTGFELFNKALGIAGFGSIGKKVALIASRGFGMHVFAYDSLSLPEQAAKESMSSDAFLSNYGVREYYTDFDSFIKKVNILTIHLPVNENTRYYFNSDRLEKMNPDSILINTGRGALIDEKALYTALSSRRLRAAAIDVFDHEPYEPIPPEYDLRKLPNIILTPHAASDTIEANENIERKVMENIHFFLSEKYEGINRVV
jgi:lactate dehydrogenase-like 2-hydroxyacid dehydrogenase